MSDPLSDVIQRAIDTYPWDDRGKVTMPDHITAVLSAHLATLLDAEEAKWDDGRRLDYATGARAALDSLRATLLGTEDADRG